MSQDAAKDLLEFQIKRAVINLCKTYLESLEDLRFKHDDFISKAGGLSKEEMAKIDYFTEGTFQRIRKRTLDVANQHTRDLTELLDKFNIDFSFYNKK